MNKNQHTESRNDAENIYKKKDNSFFSNPPFASNIEKIEIIFSPVQKYMLGGSSVGESYGI